MSVTKKLIASLVASAALTASFAVPASAQSMDELVKAAEAEGQLTTIALPHDWCGYGVEKRDRRLQGQVPEDRRQ